MQAITIREVRKRFSDVLALDAVSLHIEAGELFFLLGPSGCGKTTLLRCLAGFCTPDRGSIRFGDREVAKLPAHQREAGMVFQNYALWPHLTVFENVAFGLRERRLPREDIHRRTEEALAMVQLASMSSRKPNQLSGGQQQRVALARALVIRPRALLLDEPLSNLDAKLKLEMRTEIRRICKEAKLTAVYVTHDQKEALSIADRLAVMDRGRIAQVGSPAEVYRSPRTRFVADFLGETNFLPGTVLAAADRTLEVSTSVGIFRAKHAEAFPNDFAKGTGVTLSIRPEAICFANSGSSQPNTFQGRITQTVYLGEVAQHQVACEDLTLKVFQLNPVPGALPPAAHFCVDPSEVVVLSE